MALLEEAYMSLEAHFSYGSSDNEDSQEAKKLSGWATIVTVKNNQTEEEGRDKKENSSEKSAVVFIHHFKLICSNQNIILLEFSLTAIIRIFKSLSSFIVGEKPSEYQIRSRYFKAHWPIKTYLLCDHVSSLGETHHLF